MKTINLLWRLQSQRAPLLRTSPTTHVSGCTETLASASVRNVISECEWIQRRQRLINAFTMSVEYVTYVQDVIRHVALALGIPGNILSAIVWLRGHVVSKHSSSVYLAALAIVDLIFPAFELILEKYQCHGRWFCKSCWTMTQAAALLEPLLVLTFSVERLIAIRRPLQVCYVYPRR